MRSYSETNVFLSEHLALFKEVQTLVSSFPDTDNEGRLLRCHEVARAVAIAFDLIVIDGVYGCVQHSWCLIPRTCGGLIKTVADDSFRYGDLPQEPRRFGHPLPRDHRPLRGRPPPPSADGVHWIDPPP
jgi:hypothetical protein